MRSWLAVISTVVVLGSSVESLAGPVRKTPKPVKEPRRCVADATSYCELKLVGTVLVRDKRTALVVDPQNRGHIISPGDCAGRERVVVRAITRAGLEHAGNAVECRLDSYPVPPPTPAPRRRPVLIARLFAGSAG